MAYDKPAYSFNQIDKAGKACFDEHLPAADRVGAIEAILNWRAAHSYPLNAIHMTLRNRTLKVDVNGTTAQRLKRSESILRKLRRQTTMQMSQMQDIGGCRSIVSTMGRLNRLKFLYETHPLRHALTKTRDYIEEPKDDGYRSIHLMYRFSGKATSLPWDKLRIEVQLRTKLQHAWATSVETVDAFTQENLKFGKGASNWRRFFRLMGSVHAVLEKTPVVHGTPDDASALRKELRELEQELKVIRNLKSYATLAEHITRQQGDQQRDWYLIRMMPIAGTVSVQGFLLNQFDDAKRLLAESEQEFESTSNQVVLVATGSLNELRRAYPNYFADTAYFTNNLQKFLKG